jgi:hypothetical protein
MFTSPRAWLLLLVLAVAAGAAPARAQDVKLSVDVDSVAVGERFRLTVAVTHPFRTTVRFPAASAGTLLFGDVEALRRVYTGSDYLGMAAPGTRRDTVIYEATTFALGRARIPAFSVEVVTGTDTAVVSAEPFSIPVRATAPRDAARLRDVGPPADFPRPVWPWVLVALAVLGLVALAAYVLWQRRQRAGEDALGGGLAPAPPEPPHKVALRTLRFIELNTDLHDPAHLKPFYTDLAAALRTYLADRLRIPARERTTPELAALLRRHAGVPRRVRGQVAAVLELADLVKFADLRPDAEANRQAVLEARGAIAALEDALRPPPEPEDGADADAPEAPAPAETTPEA